MNVTCDKCHKDFKIRPRTVNKTVYGHKIVKTYFRCPKCKTQYPFLYDNWETAFLKHEIKMAEKDLSKQTLPVQYQKQTEKLRFLQNELGNKQKQLKEVFEKE